MNTVYLIHFDRPIGNPANPRGQAKHYLGCTNNLKRRLREHRSGNGSRIMHAVSSLSIPWKLARTWEGNRGLERKLKSCHQSSRLCPLCKAEYSRH